MSGSYVHVPKQADRAQYLFVTDAKGHTCSNPVILCTALKTAFPHVLTTYGFSLLKGIVEKTRTPDEKIDQTPLGLRMLFLIKKVFIWT